MDKPPSKTRYGATPEDWQRLDALGVGADLLPVVSNPNAEISPTSTMKQLGKTPSRYDRDRKVTGIARWTEHQASDADLKRWSAEPDYGICVQTRLLRVLDIDVENRAVVDAIVAAVQARLLFTLPRRSRRDSAKCALAFKMEGTFPKRIMRVEGGAIEFLGDGQQFIAYGTHPKGARYEWAPAEVDQYMVEITPQLFETIWSSLEEQFAIETPTISKAPSETRLGEHLDVEDPVADWLEANGHVLSETRRGALVITCPWEHEHSSDTTGSTSTVWFRAGTNGHSTGHFKCAHAHCEHRNRQDFLMAVGYPDDRADDFEDLGPDPDTRGIETGEEGVDDTPAHNPFRLLTVEEFLSRPRPTWLVKGLIPKADLGVVYGASGAGKSFIVLDIAMAIARGIPWRGLRVRQGKVIYICAEGVGGFRNRVEAYCQQHKIESKGLPLRILDAVPNLLDAKQVKQLAATIEAEPDVSLIVCDTFAQMTPGANENAGEDMGKAISYVRHVGRKVGAVTVLVHHSGKDAAKGARGWSGIRAAADFEMEVTRDGENRALNTTKQKDADDQASWGFRLEQVIIALDEDGDDIKSAIVLESEVQVEAGVNGGKRRASQRKEKAEGNKWESLVLEAYQELAVGGRVLRTELNLLAKAKAREAHSDIREGRTNYLINRAVKTLVEEGKSQVFYEDEGFVFEKGDE